MIVLTDEVERPPGMCHGSGHIAEDQGLSGTVDGDRTRKSAKSLLVHNDHLRRWGLRSPPNTRRPVEPPFGVAQPRLNALDLAPHK